jgi:hypothetical protein
METEKLDVLQTQAERVALVYSTLFWPETDYADRGGRASMNRGLALGAILKIPKGFNINSHGYQFGVNGGIN